MSLCRPILFLLVPISPGFEKIHSISLSDVKNEEFISLSGAKHFRAICDKFCKSEHIQPNIVFESESHSAVKNMIAANIGVGVWSAFSWEKFDTNSVKLLKINKSNCTRDILITYKNNKKDDKNAFLFFEFLQTLIQKEKIKQNYV